MFMPHTGDERQVINFWQGRHATNLEQGAAALLATDMHNNKFKGTHPIPSLAFVSCLGSHTRHIIFVPEKGLWVTPGLEPLPM